MSIVLHGRRNLLLFENLAEKLVVSTIKLFCFDTHFHNFFSVICLKSVSQRDTAVSCQKRPKSVPGGMSAALYHLTSRNSSPATRSIIEDDTPRCYK